MRKTSVSAIQFDVKFGDLKSNAERAVTLLEKAAQRGSNLAVLPEMWLMGFDYEGMAKLSPAYVDDILELLSDIARKGGMNIVAGTLCEMSEGKFYNSSYFIDEEGKIMGKYRKTHLFKEIGEAQFFTAGSSVEAWEAGIGVVGAAVCYDLRFPELFTQIALKGAEVICVPAQFPVPREEHWEVLLRARAIENQLFVIGVNRIGQMGKIEYFGRSVIVGPYGEIIEQAGEKEEIITATIDIERLYEIRKFLPTLPERRPDVYKEIAPKDREFSAQAFDAPPETSFKKFEPFKFKDTVQPMKPRE